MPTAPAVTVLIAAYNAEDFISRALNSALDQQGIDIEVLVVDDASTDRTREVVSALCARDPRVRLICLEENGGPSVARNAGLDAAKGQWVAILDADDLFLPERLRRLVTLGDKYRADIVADNFLYYDAHSEKTGRAGLIDGPDPETIGLYDFLSRTLGNRVEADYGILQPLLRREFLERARLRYPTGARHGEDFILIFELLMKGAIYVLTRTPGYLYTTRNSGWSRTRIDYNSIVDDLRALLRRADVRSDKSANDLIRQRVRAVRKMAARASVADRWTKHDFLGLLCDGFRNYYIAGETWRRARKSFRSRAKAALSDH